MVGNNVVKSDTSKKLVFESIKIRRLNVVIMTIMLYRQGKYRGTAVLARLFLEIIK